MPRVRIIINGSQPDQKSLADSLVAAVPSAIVQDIHADDSWGRSGSAKIDYDRPIRCYPSLLVDSDDGLREIDRQEEGSISVRVVRQKLNDGTYASQGGSAKTISSQTSLRNPGDEELAAIKEGLVLTAEQIAAWIRKRF